MAKTTKKSTQATSSKKPIEKNHISEQDHLSVVAITSSTVDSLTPINKVKVAKSVKKSKADAESNNTDQNHETSNQISNHHEQDNDTLSVISYADGSTKDFFDANMLVDVADSNRSSISTPLLLGAGVLALGAGIALANNGGDDNHCTPSTNDGTSSDLSSVMSNTFRSLTIENQGSSDIEITADGLTIEQELTITTDNNNNNVYFSGDVIFGDQDCGLEADLTFTSSNSADSQVNIGKYVIGATGDGAEGAVHDISIYASGDGSSQFVDIVNMAGDETLTVSGCIDILAEGDGVNDSRNAEAGLDLSGDIRFENVNLYVTAANFDDQANLYTNYNLSENYGHTLAGTFNEVSVGAWSNDADAGWYMSGDIDLSIHSLAAKAWGNDASAEIVMYSHDSEILAQQNITFTGGDVVAETNMGTNGHALINFYSADSVNGEIDNLEALAAGAYSDAQIQLASDHGDSQVIDINGDIKLTAFGDSAWSSIDVGNAIVMHGGDIMMCADSNTGESAEINLYLNAGGISGSVDTLTLDAFSLGDDVYADLEVTSGLELSLNSLQITASGDNMFPFGGNNAQTELQLGVTEHGDVASLKFNDANIDINAEDDYASVLVNQSSDLDVYGRINEIDIHANGESSDIRFELFNRTDDARTLTIGISRDNELNVRARSHDSDVRVTINGDIHLDLNEIEVSADGQDSYAYLNLFGNTTVTGSVDGITVGTSSGCNDATYATALLELNAEDLVVGSLEVESDSASSDAILRIAGNIVMDHENSESEIIVKANYKDSYAAIEKFDTEASVMISGEMSGDIHIEASGQGSDAILNADFDHLVMTSGDIVVSSDGLGSRAIASMDGTIEMNGGDLTVVASDDYSVALLNANSSDVLELSGSIDNLSVLATDYDVDFAIASADISTNSIEIDYVRVAAGDENSSDSNAAFLDVNMTGDNYIHSMDISAGDGGRSDFNYASLGINIAEGASLTLGNGDDSSDITVTADWYQSSAVLDIQGAVTFDLDQIYIESGYSNDHVNFNIEGQNSGYINEVDMIADDGAQIDFALDINGDIHDVYLHTYGYDASGIDTRSEINATFDLRGDVSNSIDLLDLRADDYSNINLDIYQDGIGGNVEVYGENDWNSSDITLSYHGGRASFIADYNDTGWPDFRLNLLDLEDNNYSIHDNTDEILKDEMLTFDSFWAGQDTLAFDSLSGDAGNLIVQDDDFGFGVAGLNSMIAEAESYLNGVNKYYYADWMGDGYLFYDHDGVGISQMVKINDAYWSDNIVPTDSEFLTSSVIGITGYDVV